MQHIYLRPKGRGTKASGGVRHGDSYKGIITDIDVYIYIYMIVSAHMTHSGPF